jgi:hypothetical protein
MIPVHSQYTIDLGLFEQRGGWVFVAVPHGAGFYGDALFSGKRRTMNDAIDAAKKMAGDVVFIYCML